MGAVLIVYGTSYGQTGKVVARIADRLNERGHDVTLWNAEALPAHPRLDQYDFLLLAGSVRYGKHQRALGDFVRWNVARLSGRSSAFVSVCGALAGNWTEGVAEAKKYVDEFCRETGWTPGMRRSFAGAVCYTKYGLFTRWIMRMISWRTGRPTDTSRDWEFTDWNAVDEFAAEIAARLAAPGTASGVPSRAETGR